MRKELLVSISIFLLANTGFAQSSATSEGVVSVRNEESSLPAVTPHLLSETVPSLLQGIWQGEDRLVMFSNQNEFALVLRVFYQWYNDRASEPASFSEIKSRDRNNTTKSPAEDIQVQYITICENPSKTAGVYELSVKYPHEKLPVLIPVCVLDDKIFMDFLIKDSAEITDLNLSGNSENLTEESVAGSRDGFYRAASSANGISIAQPIFEKEVLSYFVNDGEKEIYKIRYWLSDMDYTYAKATFSDGDKIFSVDKYLRIGSNVFQCTTGRSSKIRNIQKSTNFGKPAFYDSDGGIVAFGKPYLVKVPEAGERDLLLSTVEENNKRKKPAPKPLFPPTFPKYRWKEITELELYNPSTWNKRNLDIHK
ncbi:hypothetical protein [uncultured Treponema sp.]|uniref:hypothetical protein n=1 Tax=uncultured Treponema sp. TaxID=162155 RepID=UPI0025D62146|nr:hypothetical protein [uncultured Treponema sp.]